MSDRQVSIAEAMQMAIARHRAGQLDEARAIYTQIHTAVPTHYDALHMAGVVAMQQGDAAQAESLIGRSLAIQPFAAAFANRGIALEMLGRLDEAAAAFRAALQREPDHAEALKRLGRVLCLQKDYAGAIAVLTQLATRLPDSFEASSLLGIALEMDYRLDEAIARYRHALALQPGSIDMRNHLGLALLRKEHIDEAVGLLNETLALQPEHAKTLANLGYALVKQRRYVDAEPVLRRARSLSPADPLIAGNLVSALLYQGRQADATQLALQALRQFPDALHLHSPLLAALACDGDCAPETYLEAAKVFGTAATNAATPITAWQVAPAGSDVQRLRVGLVSGDLRQHPVGYFLENFIAHIDPQRIEFVAYKTRPDEDALTRRLQNHIGEWHDISGLLDEPAAQKIRADGIHLLIDLAGHTASNRLPLFAWKPAPVQLSWLGYSASTGLPAMDWLLADAVSVPQHERGLYSERCWYIPESRICFTPPADAPDVALLPALRHAGITFGTFQNMSKLTDGTLALWARVLHAVSGARLRVQNGELSDDAAQAAFLLRLEQHGISPRQVQLAGRMPRHDYLAAHAEVDIILDTFPYPGGTTTCEALWMGVPTLALAGRTLLSRYGASVLTAVGLPQWIAGSEQAYVDLAIAHAADLQTLAALRNGLRARVGQSSLCNGALFAQRFTDALHGMWRAAATG